MQTELDQLNNYPLPEWTEDHTAGLMERLRHRAGSIPKRFSNSQAKMRALNERGATGKGEGGLGSQDREEMLMTRAFLDSSFWDGGDSSLVEYIQVRFPEIYGM